MRRISTVFAVFALALALVPASFAIANPDNNGNASTAPGSEIARDKCGNVTAMQFINEIQTGGGPKADSPPGPTNCDHYYQNVGLIGND